MRKTIIGTAMIVAGYGLAIFGVYNLLLNEVNDRLAGIRDRLTTLEIGYATLRVGDDKDDLK